MTPPDFSLALLVSVFGVFLLAVSSPRPRRLVFGIGLLVFITLGLVFFSKRALPDAQAQSPSRFTPPAQDVTGTVTAAELASKTPEAVLLEVRRLVPKIEERYGDRYSILIDLARVQAQMGDYKGIQESISQMKMNEGMWTESYLIDALLSAGQLEDAKRTAQEVDAQEIRARVLALVAEAYAQHGRVDEALRIAAGIDPKWDQNTVYGLIARAQAQAGDLDGALKTLAQVVASRDAPVWGERRKGYVVASIAKQLATAGKLNAAYEFITEVQQPYDQDYGWWGVVQGQLAAGDLEGAIATAEWIATPEARAFALSDIAEKEIENGKRDEGIARLRDAARMGKDIAEASARGRVLLAIANRQTKVGDAGQAMQSAAFIEGDFPKHLVLGRVLGKLADDGDIAGVRRTIAVLQADFGDADKGVFVGLSIGSIYVTTQESSINALVHAYVRAGDLDGAMKIVRTLRNSDASLGLTDIAQAYAEAGNMKEALRIAGEIEGKRGKDRALSGIAQQQAEDGHVSDAVATIAQMQVGDEKNRALYALGNIQVKTSGHGGAFEWVGALKQPSEQASALLGIASAMIDESKSQGSRGGGSQLSK